MTDLRKLLWLYLWLLIFEGALRKWIVPALDTPLLIIRDPLVIWIYYQAARQRLSFNNSFFMPNILLAAATALISIFGYGNLLVTIYGLRTNYLQIPLIFLIPQILNRDDVVAMGRFLFYMSIPIAALVILQFRSPLESIWNKGAMATHYGTVRPSGTFSFVTGLSAFFALVASFLLYGYLNARTYKIWLMALVTFSILLASACSGSRTCLGSIALVVVAAVLCVVFRGKGGMGIIVAAVLIGLALAVLSTTPVFKEGTEQLNQRMEDTAAQGEDTGGSFARVLDSMLLPVMTINTAPLFGNGLGIGTNAGFAMVNTDLIWPEQEWARLIFESGPIFGLLLCIFRVALTVAIARSAFAAFRRDNILPVLIFASIGLLVLNGQWGVPTVLGFVIFGGGLMLAACVEPPEWEEEDHEHEHEHEEAHAEGESDQSPATDRVG